MTKINRLFARGLKCGDFDHQLQAVNLIVGKNFSGKTSRLEAIRLALIGYLPELGKQPAANLALARNGTMTVGIETDLGTITRTFARKVPTETQISGDMPDIPPVLMDSREYFNLGAKDQVRYIFARCNVDEAFNGSVLTAAVKNIKLPENTEQTEAAIARVVSLIEETDYNRQEHDESVQTWLEDLIAKLKDKLKTAKGAAEASTGLVRSMTGMQATEAGAALRDVSGEIAGVRSKINEAVTQSRMITAKISEEAAKEQRRENMRGQLVELDPIGMEAEKNIIEKQVADLNLETAGYVSFSTQLLVESQRLTSDISNEQKILTDLSRDASADAAKTAELCGKPCCPTCGSKKKGWQEEIEKALAERQAERKQRSEDGLRRITVAKAKVAVLADKIKIAREGDCQNDLNRRKLDDTKSALHSIEIRLIKHASMVKSLAELGEPLDIAAERTLAGKLDQDITSMNAQLTNLDMKQKAFVQAQQDTKRMAQAQLQTKAVEADVLILKESVKVIEQLQVDMVDKSLGAILDTANKVVGAVVDWRLEFSNGELGRYVGKTWISHEVFSGLEKAIAYAGISVSLAAGSPIKIVMIDEVLIDVDSREKLLSNMLELTESGFLDQFILVDVNDSAEREGVNIIRL